MKIIFFTLCDYATNEKGHLTIVNTRDLLEVEKLPWRAYLGFAIKGYFDKEYPQTTLTLSIYKAEQESQPIFKTSADIKQGVGKFQMAGNLRGLIFNEEGEYEFRIESNHGLKFKDSFKIELSKPHNKS